MRIKKHIPNTITCLNLLCGVLGIIALFEGSAEWAFCLLLLAAVFDFCDGLAARMLGAYSEMGKELDSLSDVVSFGVLPALMLFTRTDSSSLDFLTLSVAVFSGLRLAKFNLDERQHEGFLGLPTPACAILCGAFICYDSVAPGSWAGALCSIPWFLPALAVVLSALLVCEIPMFSLKISTGKKADTRTKVQRAAFLVLAVAAVLYSLIVRHHFSLVFVLIVGGYVVINLVSLPFGRKSA